MELKFIPSYSSSTNIDQAAINYNPIDLVEYNVLKALLCLAKYYYLE